MIGGPSTHRVTLRLVAFALLPLLGHGFQQRTFLDASFARPLSSASFGRTLDEISTGDASFMGPTPSLSQLVSRRQSQGTAQALDEALPRSTDLAGTKASLQQLVSMRQSQGTGQPHGEVVHTEHETYFERLQNSLLEAVAGCLLIVFSIPILWLNENRSAKMESLIMKGNLAYRTVEADHVDLQSRGSLVHVRGAHMRSCEVVTDAQFDVRLDDCVRLRTTSEVYQPIEKRTTETRETVGGGRDRIVSYSYTFEWSPTVLDTSCYHDVSYRQYRPAPIGMQPGVVVTDSQKVELGSAFELPLALVKQCTIFEPAFDDSHPSIQLHSKYMFKKGPDNFFYYRHGCPDWAGEGVPQAGDCRVAFHCVPHGIVTVLALQGDLLEGAFVKSSLLPYRVISPGAFCGVGRRVKDEASELLREGKKTASELAQDSSCSCLPSMCCCACTIVAKACSGAFSPEIFHISTGDHDAETCFAQIEGQQVATTWLMRFGGWLCMFVGLNMLFAPFTTVIVVIPFLGPILQSCGNFIVSVFSFLVTVIISFTIIVMAWLVYHPIVAFQYSLIAATITLAVIGFSRGFLN